MNKSRKCIHIYVEVDGFDKCELQLIKNKFVPFARKLNFEFDCDYISVSHVKEFCK